MLCISDAQPLCLSSLSGYCCSIFFSTTISCAENGAKAAAAAAAADGLVLESAAVVSGDELSVSSEVTTQDDIH
jgi:hypothetical protein